MLTMAPPERGALRIVPGSSTRPAGPVVLAAIDDDAGARPVLARAREEAARLGVPLRVVHVWANRRQRMAAADRLTSDCVADCLPSEEMGFAERQILHDADPARALVALSRDALLLVVAAKPGGSLGSTVRRLAGRARCPLAIVPAAPVTRGRW
jgi:nucleotide-binding universal stress UspA family protein